LKENNEFILLRKGDRVRKYDYDKTSYKDGTVTLGGKVGTSGCFVTFDDGTKGIFYPEDLTKLKLSERRERKKHWK